MITTPPAAPTPGRCALRLLHDACAARWLTVEGLFEQADADRSRSVTK